MEQSNLTGLPTYLTDEADAWKLLERLRWPEGEVVCPHCGAVDPKHYFIAARSGERKTRTGTTTCRRLWRCRYCRKQFSVLVGTVFESSKVPVSKWLLAMWLFSASKNGVSTLELQRRLVIAYQTAWFMAHRLREAVAREPLASLWSGEQGLTDKTPAVGKGDEGDEAGFEELVVAALKVDPQGLSGKHRKVPDQGTNPDPEIDTEP